MTLIGFAVSLDQIKAKYLFQAIFTSITLFGCRCKSLCGFLFL